MENSNKQNQYREEDSDVFSTPFVVEKKKKEKATFLRSLKGVNKKKIIYIVLVLIVILLIFLLLITGSDNNLFKGEIKSVRNYSTGLEASIESFLFYLHNDEPLPDSIKFYFDKVSYIDLHFQETCGLKRIKELLSKRGFVHSIIIESKTFKDLGVNSWIYRTNFIEGDYINAEYIIDFEYKNDTLFPKSFELLSETKKQKEDIGIPSKDTVIKKKKRETEVISIDTLTKNKIDSAKKKDTKIEEREIKQEEQKEESKDKQIEKIRELNENELIQKKEQGKEDKPRESEEK
ncbi:MAG: hypothetical protein N2490_04630 [Ignavibacteria bacterium]|nr:hypothetical protein [Ignavibacteria bacterium]